MTNRLRLYAEASPLTPGGDAEVCREMTAGISWHELGVGVRIVLTPDGRPIRRIMPRSRRPIGMYASRKAGRLLAHESRGVGFVGGEKLALMRREIDPETDDFRTQHVRFDLMVGGYRRSHVPDILAIRYDGSIEVDEVKADRRWQDDDDYRAMVDVIAGICRDIGWGYRVSTARDVAPTRVIRDNIVQIQAERYVDYGTVELTAVHTRLRRGGGRAVMGDLTSVLGGTPGAQALVKGMMCHGHLRIPLDRRIGPETVVTRFVRDTVPEMRLGA